MSSFSQNPFVTSVPVAAVVAGAPGLYPAMAFVYNPLMADEVEMELGRKAEDGKAFTNQMRAVIRERVLFWSWSADMAFVAPGPDSVEKLKHGALRDIYLTVMGISRSAPVVASEWKWPEGVDLSDLETQQGKS